MWLTVFGLFLTSSVDASAKVGEVDVLVCASKDDPRFSWSIEMVGAIILEI